MSATTTQIGPAFLLNAIGGVVIALLLLFWKHWAPPLLAIGFGISTISAFTISATVGMYGVHEHWTGGYVWTRSSPRWSRSSPARSPLLQERAARAGTPAHGSTVRAP